MIKRSITLTIASLGLLLGAAAPAYAMDFGSCLNPQWSVSQVNVGNDHGVIGVGTFAGKDTIYSSGGNVLQCLCTGNGKGYQTNWLKASNLSDSEISVYKNEGWKYVATGSNWGLQDTPYLAKNSEYTCNGEEAKCTPTPTPTVTVTPTTTPGASNTPTPGANATNTPTPQVQSGVFSLAKTGNAALISAFVLSGIASLIIGMVLKKFSK